MANSAETKPEYTGTVFQGWILVSAAWLSTMANQVMSPKLPSIHLQLRKERRWLKTLERKTRS